MIGWSTASAAWVCLLRSWFTDFPQGVHRNSWKFMEIHGNSRLIHMTYVWFVWAFACLLSSSLEKIHWLDDQNWLLVLGWVESTMFLWCLGLLQVMTCFLFSHLSFFHLCAFYRFQSDWSFQTQYLTVAFMIPVCCVLRRVPFSGMIPVIPSNTPSKPSVPWALARCELKSRELEKAKDHLDIDGT